MTAMRDEGKRAGRLPGRVLERSRRRIASPVVTLTAVLALAGCSSVPDALNPVEWYEATTDTVGGWFSDDEPAPASTVADNTSTDSAGFPNLSTVPPRPTTSTTEEERAQLQQGLVADRDNARYADSNNASAPADAPAAGQSSASGSAAPAPSAPVAGSTESASTAATEPAAPTPPPSTTIARTPPPAPRVAPSGEHSTLWPRRPAPERTSSTPVTSGRVSDSHSAVVPPTPTGQAVVPQPRSSTAPQATRATGSSLDSAGNAPSSTPPQAPAAQAAAPSAREPSGGAASDQSAAVIVDGPSLDQYQLGFSGPAYLVGTVNFGHSSAGLNGADRELIASIAAAAQETDAFVRVVGHASARTAEMPLSQHELVNFEISLARAQAVAAALVQAGVPEDRVLVEAMSASQPLYFESMPSGEAGNRRAEILFQY